MMFKRRVGLNIYNQKVKKNFFRIFIQSAKVLLDIRAVSYLFRNNECKTTSVVNPLRIGCIKQSVRESHISDTNGII